MTTEPTYLQLLHRVQSPRRTTRQSLALAVVFAAEALLAGIILVNAYNFFHANGYAWALVSAILVLQPGLEQSLNTALVRIAANMIGAFAGYLIGTYLGVQTSHVLAAIIAVIFLCELLRLDLGVRSACVSVVIVMTANEGQVASSSIERGIAVLAGCSLALVIQLLVERLLSRLNLLPRLPDPPPAVPLKPVKEPATQTE